MFNRTKLAPNLRPTIIAGSASLKEHILKPQTKSGDD
jgi:hypothetical protein